MTIDFNGDMPDGLRYGPFQPRTVEVPNRSTGETIATQTHLLDSDGVVSTIESFNLVNKNKKDTYHNLTSVIFFPQEDQVELHKNQNRQGQSSTQRKECVR